MESLNEPVKSLNPSTLPPLKHQAIKKLEFQTLYQANSGLEQSLELYLFFLFHCYSSISFRSFTNNFFCFRLGVWSLPVDYRHVSQRCHVMSSPMFRSTYSIPPSALFLYPDIIVLFQFDSVIYSVVILFTIIIDLTTVPPPFSVYEWTFKKHDSVFHSCFVLFGWLLETLFTITGPNGTSLARKRLRKPPLCYRYKLDQVRSFETRKKNNK